MYFLYSTFQKVILGCLFVLLCCIGLLVVTNGRPASGILAQEREFFLIDLNKATPEELRLLPFVSDSMAEEIIRYRTEKGGFKSIDELSEIKGIGPARLKKMRKYLKDTN